MIRPRATTPVLLARAVGGLTVIAVYVAVRLPSITSAWEAALTWVGAVLCLALALPAIEQLAVQHRDRLAPGEPSPLELTDRFEVPLGWPGIVENQIAEARHAAMAPLIDRGEIVEPRLFTHEFDALHHTPPRGIPAVGSVLDWNEYWSGQTRVEREPAAELIRRIRAERPSPTGRVVVSHTAPVQIARDRFGHLFGSY